MAIILNSKKKYHVAFMYKYLVFPAIAILLLLQIGNYREATSRLFEASQLAELIDLPTANRQPPRMIMNQYQKCMLELEAIMHPKIWQLREERIPIPISVRIIDNKYYILLLVYHVPHLDEPLRSAQEIFCNDRPGGKVIGHKLKKTPVDTIVVECPEALNPDDSNISNLNIVLPPSLQGNETRTYTYGKDILGKMDECEKLDISYFQQLRQHGNENSDKREVKIGASIIIRSYLQPLKKKEWRGGQAKSMREQAIEYAEYHHLLGVDHIWIYINEAWKNGEDLPHRDYISWIPSDWNLYNYQNFTRFPGDQAYFETFRAGLQSDALSRARREGMDWIVMNDVDEYVRIGPSADRQCPDNECGMVGSLTRFMRNYTDMSDRGIAQQYKEDGGAIMGGIRLESVYYGNNKEVDQPNNIALIIDNVWRKKRPADFEKSFYEQNHRRKMIVDPSKALTIFIHGITSSIEPFTCCQGDHRKSHTGLIEIEDDVIRVNHYKQPHTGVQKNEKQSHKPADTEKDSLLKDRFHDLMIEALEKNITD